MPRTIEVPPKGPPETPAVVLFERIAAMRSLLEQDRALTDEETLEVRALLRDIDMRTEQLEGVACTFLDEQICTKLKALIPDAAEVQNIDALPNLATSGLSLCVDGEETIQAIIRNIRAAKKRIEIKMFIWNNDETGQAVAKELYLAALRGVTVVIRKDRKAILFERGRSMFHRQLNIAEALQTGLVRQFVADPPSNNQDDTDWGAKILELSEQPAKSGEPRVTIDDGVRNDHSKVFLFDNEVLMLGGINLTNQGVKEMHDYMVEIRSPSLVGHYKDRLRGKEKDKPAEGASIGFSMNSRSGWLDKSEILPMMQDLIASAEESLVIEMAYFGDPTLTQSVIDAAKRGVKVSIITSEQSNVQNDLNHTVLQKILYATEDTGNMTAYLCRPTHAKLIHADGTRTLFGSANMNTTATVMLGETDIYVNCADCDFTKRLQRQLQRDMEESRIVRAADLNPNPAVAGAEGLIAG